MPGVARLDDAQEGTCNLPCEDGGPIDQTGKDNVLYSPDVFANGLNVMRLNDQGETLCPCENIFEVTAGSGDVFANSLNIGRIGDPTECTTCGGAGSLTVGSGDVIAN